MKKTSGTKIVIVVIGLLSILFLSLVTNSYYKNVMESLDAGSNSEAKHYDYHLVMIVNDGERVLWQDAYESMKRAADAQGAVVELLSTSLLSDNDLADLMDISIASKVDGIALEYVEDERLKQKIAEARDVGIPVVTMINDTSASLHQSYVGVNTYQLGQQYSEKILALLPEGKGSAEVVVLLHDREEGSGQEQIFEQINNLVENNPQFRGLVQVEKMNMQSRGKADVDEVIRNLFFRDQGAPDVLVYMETMDTEAAYQAMIEYNKIGEVQLIGYYHSGIILDGIRRGTISSSMVIDTRQMGEYCAQALIEYQQEGRVNTYYSVDQRFITMDNIGIFKVEGGGNVYEKE